MALKFCKKCKSLMTVLTDSDGVFLRCPKCGFESVANLSSREKIPAKEKVGEGFSDSRNIFATYKHKCSKCGHVGAEINDLGVQYSDEDNLFLVTCGKCGFTERVGEKIS